MQSTQPPAKKRCTTENVMCEVMSILDHEMAVLRCVNNWLSHALPENVKLSVDNCFVELNKDSKHLMTAKVACPSCPKLVSLSVQENRVLNSNFKRHFVLNHSNVSTNQPKICESLPSTSSQDALTIDLDPEN